MRYFFSIIMFWVIAIPSSYAFDHEHKAWDQELKKYVKANGLVDYPDWKKKAQPLDDYLASLSAVKKSEFSKFSTLQQRAFLINAYNAFTIHLILTNYPVESIKDIGGFFGSPWKKEFFSLLDGDIKSLDPIEHTYLRKKPEYKDPRVHAAVNCASISCPRLRDEAFVASRLDEQLTDATKVWLADSSRNQYKTAKNEAHLSKIFDWFEEDFGGDAKGVMKFVKKYGPQDAQTLKNDADIEYLDYNWNLNGA